MDFKVAHFQTFRYHEVFELYLQKNTKNRTASHREQQVLAVLLPLPPGSAHLPSQGLVMAVRGPRRPVGERMRGGCNISSPQPRWAKCQWGLQGEADEKKQEPRPLTRTLVYPARFILLG